jgi:hypothetical protein
MAALDCPALRLLFTFIVFLLLAGLLGSGSLTRSEAIRLVENGGGGLSGFEAALHFHCFSPSRRFVWVRFLARNEATRLVENGGGLLSCFEAALYFHCISPWWISGESL